MDLETRTHIAEVLKEYPGAMLVVSHDQSFLKEIGIGRAYDVESGKVEELQ